MTASGIAANKQHHQAKEYLINAKIVSVIIIVPPFCKFNKQESKIQALDPFGSKFVEKFTNIYGR